MVKGLQVKFEPLLDWQKQYWGLVQYEISLHGALEHI